VRARSTAPGTPLLTWSIAAAACLLATIPAATRQSTAVGSPFRFVDVSSQAHLTRELLSGRPDKDHLLDSAGGGIAFLDYDRDGRLDIFMPNGWRLDGSRVVEKGKFALYHGLPDGTFEDVTDRAGVGGDGAWGTGAFVADVDGDGWPDIFVTAFGKNLLYRNLGNGRFQNVAREAGLESPGWNTGAAFFDADGDGDLDVYIASYIDQTMDDVLNAKRTLSWKGVEMVANGPFGMKGAPDHFFRNDGHGHFTDATDEAGFADKALGFGFAVRAADLDGDGLVDVYVANDSDPNYLYRNEGNGHFKEVATWAGAALDEKGASQASMGLAIGDVTGDGVLDIFVTNFSEDFATLYAGGPGGIFEDVSRVTGIGPMTYKPLKWGTTFADLDNDGDLDIVIANGHIYPQVDRHPEFIGTYAQRNFVAENLGKGSPLFRDATDSAGPGFAGKASYRGLAVGDFDNDGDLDLLFTRLDGPPVLLRNDSPSSGAWLTVIPEGSHGEPTPVGTTVTIKAAGRTQWRDVASGDSYLSTHDPRPHFGLGAVEVVDQVDVKWPDGTHTIRRDVKARQMLHIRKGS
jgi:enediyne biosynthesis protein E4